jgi:hypothetical protein
MRALLFTALIGAISAFQPCNSAMPECNGTWECAAGARVLPSYHPTYGMICNIENGGESFSMELSELCPLGGSIIDNSMCQVITNVSSTGCPDQSEPITSSMDGSIEGCAIKYPIFCPPGYAYFKEYTGCKRFAGAECVNKTEIAAPCGYYCHDGLAPVHLGLASDEYPVCLYAKYPAPADGCPTPEVLVDGYCLGYYDALYGDCSPTATATATVKPEEKPSASPEPSSDAPSASPEPSKEEVSATSKPEPTRPMPTETSKPEPSRESPKETSKPEPTTATTPEPCEHRWCPHPLHSAPDGLCVDKMPAEKYPQCEQISHTFIPSLDRCAEWTTAPFTGPADCPLGFSAHVVQNVEMCLRLYDPQWRPCPPEYDLIQSSTGERYCERVEAPKCGCPQPGSYPGCKEKDYYDAAEKMCYTWFEFTPEMRQCPSPYIIIPRNDKLFCAHPYEPIEAPCPPGFTVVIRADGVKICQTVEGEPCDQMMPAEATTTATAKPQERQSTTATQTAKSQERPTETATQTAKPEEPSRSMSSTPAPSREKPTETATQTAKPEEPSPSPRPSATPEPSRERPSPSPVTKPVITATIRIEISTNLAQNNTSDMSVFQEPEVLTSLKDAIARALGVPVDMVRIESIAWMNNGVIMSTVQIVNATGGRRLQSGNNYDIKYKVVDPPAELLALRPEEFASRVEASTAVLSAAATAVSAATGAAINANDIVVQSVEMAVAAPAAAQAAPQSSSLPIAAIAGGAGGGFVLIGAAIAVAMTIYYKQKRRRVAAARTAAPVQQAPLAETTFKADQIMVVNPMGAAAAPQFVMQNKNFSFAYSSRDLETAFTPRQARRV